MPRRIAHLATMIALLTAMFAGLTVSPVSAQSPATLNLTFLACPPGGDWSGPPAGCEEVTAAPETATLTASPDWMQPVHELDRNTDGSYTTQVPVVGSVGLVNFFSQDFNAFTFDGVDTISRWYGEVNLEQGESRDVTVYYWNGPVDLIMPAENTLVVNVMSCGEGIDPTVDASGCAPLASDVPGLEIGTPPLRQLNMADYLNRDGGTLTYSGLPAYTQAQVVVRQPLAGFDKAYVTGDAEVIEDDAATVFMLRNEPRTINIYFFAPNSEPAPVPTQQPAGDTGTLRLYLLACPPGVVPHDDPGRCTDTMTSMDTAMVSFPETGERLSLSRFDQDETGAYVIPDIRGSVTISGVLSPDGGRIASDADEIQGEEVTYRVEAGQIREGRLYYYDGK